MAQQTDKVWTPANIVTLIRILCIPVFVAALFAPWPDYFPHSEWLDEWKPLIAAIVFALISVTDALDGHLARSRNEVTNLGKFMDPLADKILVASALLCLIELAVLPSWVALIILAREFIVSGIRMVAASDGVVLAASWWGKIKTVTQIIAVVLFLIKASPAVAGISYELAQGLYWLSWAVMIAALLFTIVSMLDYFDKARVLLGFNESKHQKHKAEKVAAKQGAPCASDVEAALRASALSEGAVADLGDVDDGALCRRAEIVIELARQREMHIGTAESCTGGLIASTLTAVPGSSEVTEGGIVSYSNQAKQEVLGVESRTLSRYGAVSAQTACEMAAGACRVLGTDVAVSVTGIAGPGGAVAGKPVGTVWIGLSDGALTIARHCLFDGNRDQVRRQTVAFVLDLMLRYLRGEVLESDLEPVD